MGLLGSIVGSIASTVAGGLIGKAGQDDANKQSAKMAREQMAFEERMSSTAMRRRVIDLKAAGLNPMLAGINQQGASTPSGAKSTYENANLPLSEGVSGIMPKIMQVENLQANTAKQAAEAEQSKTQATLNEASARNLDATTPTHAVAMDLSRAQMSEIQTKIKHMESQIGLNTNQSQLIQAEIPKIGAEINRIQAETKNAGVQYNMILATTKEALARANLTSAQIDEVAPRIMEMYANAARSNAEIPNIKAELPSKELSAAAARGGTNAIENVAPILGGIRMWFDGDSSRRTNRGFKP